MTEEKKQNENQNQNYFGYCRVSTQTQNLTSQREMLIQYGVPEENIYHEKETGTNLDRYMLRTLLGKLPGDEKKRVKNAQEQQQRGILRAGDTLVIVDLPRLSRNTKDLLFLFEILTEKKIQLKCIKEKELDINPASPMGRVLLVLCTIFAQFERDCISERTRIGLASARAQGRIGGRKPLTPEKVKHILSLYRAKDYSIRALCAELKITPATLYKYVKLEKKNEQKKNEQETQVQQQ